MPENMELRKVCLIVNYNLYESKRYFTAKLAEAMERKGMEVNIIDVNEGVIGAEVITAITRFRPDLTCSFNSLLPISKSKFLWDFLETPHWSIIVDPVIYSMNLIASPYSILSCVDRFDVEAVRAFPFENVFFWPHAVERELDGKGDKHKEYDVVFLGSCYDYESLRVSWRQQNSEHINKILDDSIDLVLSDPSVPIAQALVKAWNASGKDPAGFDFMGLYYYIDNYTRGKDRVELIRSIKDAHVHVFGELSKDNAVGLLGWQPYLASMRNVTVHPSVNFDQALEILRKSKISLNSMPFFKNGSHERVFTALGCGALPITNENIFWRENFKENEEIVFFSSNHWDAVNDKINNYLSNEKSRKAIVKKGAAKVLKEHTWDKRVEQLLALLPAMVAKIYANP